MTRHRAKAGGWRSGSGEPHEAVITAIATAIILLVLITVTLLSSVC